LAAKQNLSKVGIFGLASYMVSVIQAPFRSLVAITIPILSRAWKDKNLLEIERIYKRTSTNMLIFSLFLFFCIWLNFEPTIRYLNINPEYLEGKWVFFLLGMVAIIETGTGVNSQIIGTSSYWRFELWTSLLLTSILIPLSYLLTTKYGIVGPAVANLISFTCYNTIRYVFLLKRFGLQPFSSKTLEIILISVISYYFSYFVFNQLEGLFGIIVRTSIFALIYLPLVYFRKISPDIQPVIENVLIRLRIRKEQKM